MGRQLSLVERLSSSVMLFVAGPEHQVLPDFKSVARADPRLA
jgi:hypothetical protein